MKKILFLLFAVAVIFVIWNRERLYMRDPLGEVTRDGVKQAGVQVYINYANDVLLESDKPPMYLTLVQHGDRIGTPLGLRCLHYLVCRADAATATLLLQGAGAHVNSLSSKLISFRAGDGSAWIVKLY